MAPHSSTLAWKIPWMEGPGGLQSTGSLGVGHNWATLLSLCIVHALEKEMATHSSVLAWRIPGTGEPDGLPSLGSHRVGHDWSDLAAAAAHLHALAIWTKHWSQCQNFYGGMLVCNSQRNVAILLLYYFAREREFQRLSLGTFYQITHGPGVIISDILLAKICILCVNAE